MRVTPRILGLVVAGAIGISSELAAQQPQVRFKGATMGCFYVSDPTCTPTAAATLMFLDFTGNTFDRLTTPSGGASLGTAPGQTNNFGTFTLGDTPAVYDGHFLLKVLFELPTLNPASDVVYTAAVQGEVVSNESGWLDIKFGDSPIYFYDGPTNPGYFTVKLNDVSLSPDNSPVSITGTIKTTVTPEPGTTALLATGLAGLIPAIRMRRRKNEDA